MPGFTARIRHGHVTLESPEASFEAAASRCLEAVSDGQALGLHVVATVTDAGGCVVFGADSSGRLWTDEDGHPFHVLVTR